MGVTNFDIVQANLFLGGNMLTQGNVYYVNPRTGSDNNTGKNPVSTDVRGASRRDGPLATLPAAFELCTAGQNDIIVLQAAGSSVADTTATLSSTLTWSKNNTHLIGLGADSRVAQRQRIGNSLSATGITSLLNVTATGCKFYNLHFFHGDIDDATSTGPAILISGNRNVFENCHIGGMGHSSMVGANGASIKLNGGSENLFKNCVIGLDTIAAANLSKGEIHFDGAASRNWFEDCLIQRYISNAGYVHVTIEDSTGIDRWQIFKNCIFHSDSVNRTVPQTAIFSIPAMSQGKIILWGSFYTTDLESTTSWDANSRGVIVNTAHSPTAAGAGGEATILD